MKAGRHSLYPGLGLLALVLVLACSPRSWSAGPFVGLSAGDTSASSPTLQPAQLRERARQLRMEGSYEDAARLYEDALARGDPEPSVLAQAAAEAYLAARNYTAAVDQ